MDIYELQQTAWQVAEEKGLHEALDNGALLGPREQALALLAQPLQDMCAIVQHVKRHGVDGQGCELAQLCQQTTKRITETFEQFYATEVYIPSTPALASLIRLVLVHTEVAEACEVVSDTQALGKELADILIRAGDLAETREIDLHEETERKMDYNRRRPQYFGTPQEVRQG